MTLKQYITHLLAWLREFPRWNDSEHTTTGVVGSGKYKCLICDYVESEKE